MNTVHLEPNDDLVPYLERLNGHFQRKWAWFIAKFRATLIAWAICCTCLPSLSQEEDLRFDHLTVKNGLADNLVHDILMDSKGYIWFCTQNGLSRFDGISFKNFHQLIGDSTSLNGQIALDIKEDQDGMLWIALLDGGLNRFDPITEKFKSYPLPTGKNRFSAGMTASKILIDSDNQVWVTTHEIGFNLLNKKTGQFEHFDLCDRPPINQGEAFRKNTINDIREDVKDKNLLWIASSTIFSRLPDPTNPPKAAQESALPSARSTQSFLVEKSRWKANSKKEQLFGWNFRWKY